MDLALSEAIWHKASGIGRKGDSLDAMIAGHGGNPFNIEPIKNDAIVNFGDIRDENSINYIVRDKEYIFHLAGQNDHVLSLTNPFPDIDINVKGSAVLLEACKEVQPGGESYLYRDPGAAESGELHRWMYDEHSLRVILAKVEFGRISRWDPLSRSIEGWAGYFLDTNNDGTVYKRDSLYMEATK